MLKSVIAASAALIAAATVASAHAEDATKAYFQVGGAVTHLSGENYGAVNLGIGYNFTKMFAVEADGDIGVTHKTYNVDGVNVKAKVDYAIGGYGVAYLPLNTETDFIVRGGYLKAQVKASASGLSATRSADGPAIGIGLRYFPHAGVNGVRGDITHYDFGHDGKGEIYQVAYVRKF